VNTGGVSAADAKRLVGGYEILGQLGQGGMATVYLARQLDLDRLVALKELQVMRSSDPSFARRFLREARMAGSLSHPSIVTVHDYFEAQGVPFIAMEYMDQGSLRPYIGQMSLAQVGGVMESLLAGLQYAGERGIVHRDLKPENLMVSSEGRMKIADFGIAKARNAFQTGGSLTAEGTALGTPNYMAPEQALAEQVGTWTDIYAVGVMAFEIFVGRPPFADTPQPLVVIMRQFKDPIPLVTDIDPTIDPQIARWIAWLTAKDPRARPQSAAEAWDAFEGILISILGPRWQRGARLHALPGGAAVAAAGAAGAVGGAAAAAAAGAAAAGAAAFGPATPIPVGAPTGPLTQRSLDLPTQPLDQTAAPRANLLGLDRTQVAGADAAAMLDPKAGRSHRLRNVLVALLVAGLLTGVALASTRHPATGAHAPRAAEAKRSAKPSAKPSSTSPPAAAVSSTPAATQPTPTASKGSLDKQAAAARKLARQYNADAARIDKLSASGSQLDSNLLISSLMRKTADGYTSAAQAASRGDAQGYAAGIAAATAAKGQLDQAVTAGAKAAQPRSQPAPAASGCAGDSVSDDPSDDSCGGEP
jgi:Protein kinase domain